MLESDARAVVQQLQAEFDDFSEISALIREVKGSLWHLWSVDLVSLKDLAIGLQMWWLRKVCRGWKMGPGWRKPHRWLLLLLLLTVDSLIHLEVRFFQFRVGVLVDI